MGRRCCLLALFALGCPSTPAVFVVVPDTVDYVALLELDRGRVVASSGFARWSASETLPAVSTVSAERFFVGYASADLEAAGMLAGFEAHRDAPLRVASGCEQPLPAPAWFATWSAGEVTAVGAETAPELTASWLADVCPQGTTQSTVDAEVRCNNDRCTPYPAWTGPCSFDLDLSLCGVGFVRGSVNAAGDACIDVDRWQCKRRDDRTSTAPYHCSSPQVCELDVHVGDPPPSPVVAETFTLREVPPFTHSHLPRLSVIYPSTAWTGYAFDLAVTADLVAVAMTPSDKGHGPCPNSEDPPQVRLHLLDPADPSAPATVVDAPDCLNRLAVDPGAGAFVGTFVRTGTWWFGRFDSDGQLIASSDTGVPLRPPTMREEITRVREIVWSDAIRSFVLLFTHHYMPLDGHGVVMAIDGRDLSVGETAEVRDYNRAYGMALTDPWTVAVLFADVRGVAWVDLRTFSETERMQTDPRTVVVGSMVSIYHDRDTGRLLIPARTNADIESIASDRAVELAWDLQPRPLPVEIVTAPFGTLVSSVVRESTEAVVTTFDPRTLRFGRGRLTVGHGLVTRMRVGPDGAVWALLPWAAKLVRLAPR